MSDCTTHQTATAGPAGRPLAAAPSSAAAAASTAGTISFLKVISSTALVSSHPEAITLATHTHSLGEIHCPNTPPSVSLTLLSYAVYKLVQIHTPLVSTCTRRPASLSNGLACTHTLLPDLDKNNSIVKNLKWPWITISRRHLACYATSK